MDLITVISATTSDPTTAPRVSVPASAPTQSPPIVTPNRANDPLPVPQCGSLTFLDQPLFSTCSMARRPSDIIYLLDNWQFKDAEYRYFVHHELRKVKRRFPEAGTGREAGSWLKERGYTLGGLVPWNELRLVCRIAFTSREHFAVTGRSLG